MDDEPKQLSMPESAPYILAFFDVLGFSSWVTKVGHKKVAETYVHLINETILKPNHKGGLSAFHTSSGTYTALTRPPSFAYFSDTIFLWSPLIPPLVAEFVERCSKMICESLRLNVALRGSITIGEGILDSDTDIYIGDLIVEGANLEKGQNWLGLTLGESAMWGPLISQLSPSSIIEYRAPMKSAFGNYASPVVVDWPRYWRENYKEALAERLVSLDDGSHSLYWNNTSEFVRFSEQEHNWFEEEEKWKNNEILKMVSVKEAPFPNI